MLDLQFPEKVKHITAVIYSDETLYSRSKNILCRKFGPLDFESAAIPFDFTDYYQPEMGPKLKRRFFSFQKLISPEKIVPIKLYNVKIEKKFARSKKRTVNLDPGYMDRAKLVLSTTKDYSHRIYLNKGIYAEVTLTYKNNQWTDLPSTFPDYRTDAYKEILSKIREIYSIQMQNLKCKIELINKALKKLSGHSEQCRLCPRECRVNRKAGERGYCSAPWEMVIYDAFLHRGEEPAISGDRGSGTIFFSGCSLKCIFCQNYQFSHFIKGENFSPDQMAELMLSLQDQGAHNINLVTPTHFLPGILKSLKIALRKGLDLPLLYNSSGYEKASIIRLLKGIIDIYLPDIKYIRPETGVLGSKAPDYPKYNIKALTEMFSQQKTPFWKQNLLKKGLIIRHLALPGRIEESKEILSWIKKHLPGALISVMFQYRPYFKAKGHPILGRPVSYQEYKQVSEFVKELGLEGWVQDFDPPEDMAGVYFEGF